MRRFVVKLILSYEQNHEPRSKFFIFEIFFLSTITVNTFSNENMADKGCYGTFQHTVTFDMNVVVE